MVVHTGEPERVCLCCQSLITQSTVGHQVARISQGHEFWGTFSSVHRTLLDKESKKSCPTLLNVQSATLLGLNSIRGWSKQRIFML